MRVVFFGTPRFAVPSLQALVDAGFEVPLVVTQPDRPVGRSGRPRPSHVAELAAARGIPVDRPERLRGNAEFFERLAAARPDVIAVVAYGKLLPSEILDLPPLGCVNVHASLLPRHRGAAPVQGAILAGDRETGVVTMRIVPELDSGPLYLERRVMIGEREDAASLSERLAVEGANLLVETLHGVAAGSLVPRPQTGEPSYSRPLSREEGKIDWRMPAEEIERRLRAFSPWPGLYTYLGSERVKLIDVQAEGRAVPQGEPGTLWEEMGKAKVAAGKRTVLVLRQVQRAGRQPVSGIDFLRGLPALPTRFDHR
jgi:methionyl-tRNA formyltransferase